MKTLIVTTLLCLGMLIGLKAQKPEQTILVVKTHIYCDHCQACGSCALNIQSKIKSMNKGVKKVKTDAKANTITVTYDHTKTSPEKIKEAILAAGYDADEQQAPAEAVNKLDGCCRK
jgi:periplasmic mercuric ion binding protein